MRGLCLQARECLRGDCPPLEDGHPVGLPSKRFPNPETTKKVYSGQGMGIIRTIYSLEQKTQGKC